MIVKNIVKITEKSDASSKSNSWRQWMCIFIQSLPLFTYGLQTAWIHPIHGPLHHQRIRLSPELLPWELPALYLSAALASPGIGWLSDKMGRRKALVYIAVIHLISWVLLLFKNDVTFISSRIYSGVSAAGFLIIVPSYMNETSQQKLRGTAIMFAMFMMGFGYFVTHLMSLFINYLSVIYLAVSVFLLYFLLSFFVEESPGFLVKSGQFEEASKIVAKLTRSDIKTDYVTNKVDTLKKECEDNKCSGNLVISIFRNQIYRSGLKIGLLFHSIRILGGSHYIMTCSSDVFIRSRISLHPHVETLVIPGALVASSLVSMILVDKIGRKILLTVSCTVLLLSLGVLGVFMQTELTVRSLNWLPLTALLTATVGYGIGLFGVPFVVMTEVFNVEVRSTGLGILFAYTWILTFIQSYTYKYIEDYMGADTVIYIYSGISIYGAIYSVFSLETNKKSTEKIAKELKKCPILK